jgi:hypothetical protein
MFWRERIESSGEEQSKIGFREIFLLKTFFTVPPFQWDSPTRLTTGRVEFDPSNDEISRAKNACTRTSHILEVKVSEITGKLLLTFNRIFFSEPKIENPKPKIVVIPPHVLTRANTVIK